MAELFSLMLESASCKSDPVAANRSQFSLILRTSLQRDASATGEISRDPRGASLCARPETISRFALEMTPAHGLVSFRARAGNAYRVMLAAMSGRRRESLSRARRGKSRPRHLHTLPTDCAASSVAADGPSAIGGANIGRVRWSENRGTKKTSETNPFGKKCQHFEGVYFFSH